MKKITFSLTVVILAAVMVCVSIISLYAQDTEDIGDTADTDNTDKIDVEVADMEKVNMLYGKPKLSELPEEELMAILNEYDLSAIYEFDPHWRGLSEPVEYMRELIVWIENNPYIGLLVNYEGVQLCALSPAVWNYYQFDMSPTWDELTGRSLHSFISGNALEWVSALTDSEVLPISQQPANYIAFNCYAYALGRNDYTYHHNIVCPDCGSTVSTTMKSQPCSGPPCMFTKDSCEPSE